MAVGGFAVAGGDEDAARRWGYGVRGALVRRGGHGRRHLRLRHRDGRRRVVHGPVPAGLLPGRVPPDEGRHRTRRQQLLQVRQPAADLLHFLVLRRRPAHRRAPRVVGHGAPRAPPVDDPRGRRLPGRCTVSGGAVNVSMAILGRALLGVGLVFANQAVPMYLSEMAPARYRGMFSNGFQFSVCLGALLATVVNYGAEKITAGWGWRLSLGLAAVPAALLTVGAIFLPETPNSLVQQGKDRGEVRALLRKIRGTDAVDHELDDIVAVSAAAQQGDNNGLQLILTRRRYRPQLAMAILIPSFTQLTGINAIGFYAPVLLRSIGMGESASLLSTIVLVVISSAATFFAMFAADRFSRRTLLLGGGPQMLSSEVLIGAIMAAKLGDEDGLSRGYAVALLLLIGVYSTGFSLPWGPLSWLVPSEIFPLEVRSAGQSVTVASSFVFTILIGQYFLAMLCRMKAWLFFFFAGWITVMTAFVYLLLPETKGLPIEQIDKVWAEHWFWRRVIGVEEAQACEKL